MTEHVPRVSIGLAVRNGERYLEEAIDSILAQTYRDFELIISDNASTDQTEEICRRYAALDTRIRYQRNPTNIGGANNENLTFTMARGEYFRWAAHDDVCAPTLLERCVALLDERKDVVLCYPMATTINEFGSAISTESEVVATASESYVRFRDVSRVRGHFSESYGLIRSEVLRRTQLQKSYTSSDRTLLAELSLYGRFHQLPEALFYRRLHPANINLDWRVRMAWFDPANHGRIVFPVWIQMFDYLGMLRRVSISNYERLRCYLYMPGWVIQHGRHLAKDLLVAGYMLIHSPAWRRKRYADLSNWS